MKSAEVLALRFGEPMKRAQSGDAAHRSAAASSNGFEVEEGRGRRIGVAYSLRNFRAKIYSVSKRRQNDGAGQV
ncbi:hypothetical protein PVAP13_6KG078200 [Panicum virgatum]|uniref:Uncharacterized protein n=1 Tax=Panicum virgatum TaxID=38727 RepID=A0A8T0R9I4_PANVG|nr:hypothetical protein PVAP13_6KG078200 [Panicum virgatum]